MNSALLLINLQNDHFPNGRMPLEKSIEVSLKAKEILQLCRSKKIPVIHTQHISTRVDANYFLPCTKGIEFHPNVLPIKNELIIKKHYSNSFKDTNLLNHLHKHKINHLIICGMMTHLCIDATVRAAADFSFHCTVLADACATKNLEFNNVFIPAQNVHYAFLAAFPPTYAHVTSVNEFIQKQSVNTAVHA